MVVEKKPQPKKQTAKEGKTAIGKGGMRGENVTEEAKQAPTSPAIAVDFCKSVMEVECSCKHYEAYGLLCRHIFCVLRMKSIKEFPHKYLNKR
ncbi:FAR1 DNA binding domain, zinc finger, SWIM-type, MULE transposase domain containing protein [Tanacetum coccineum]|uniref:FAR1 DNA binding domain, zinc finger, SWIM-type, MULE transposase domain containing protein n=1 Tax=Tanacetum coccineum TaxID=301880 RepID=A0ABQ5AU47_9ASTR